ncbi:MAG: glutamine synthetase [Phycisphaerae bacterium]|nr:glutamine synthetase [Phycisphaerae bacterium]
MADPVEYQQVSSSNGAHPGVLAVRSSAVGGGWLEDPSVSILLGQFSQRSFMPEASEHLGSEARFVRVTWVDNAGIIRGEAMHRNHFEADARNGFYVSQGAQGLSVMRDAIVPESGLGPAGGAWLIPDWDSLRTLPHAPGLSAVMGDFVTAEGEPWSCCPRACLRRAEEQLAQLGLTFEAAFENEFYLLHCNEDGEYTPFDESHYASAYGLVDAWPILDDMARSLEVQHVSIENMMAESGPGQFEIVVGHGSAMRAADTFLTVRETVHAVARSHGLIASFLPKVFPCSGGNGCHLHFSLNRDGHNVFPDPGSPDGLSREGQQALAGVLDHLPALAALTTPCPNSYRRLTPGTWSGAFQCWGHDNKEAAVRVPAARGAGGTTNIELKTFDATANPYIGLAGVIQSVVRGLTESIALPDAIDVDPATLPKGTVIPMPRDTGEALKALEADEALREMLGKELSRAYLAVKHAEWSEMEDQSHEQITRALLETF